MPWHFGIPMVGALGRVTMVYTETLSRVPARVTMVYTETLSRVPARTTMVYTETVVHR